MPNIEYKCFHCWNVIPYKRKSKKFCSQKCSSSFGHRDRCVIFKAPRECMYVGCTEVFIPKKSHQIFCSKKCRMQGFRKVLRCKSCLNWFINSNSGFHHDYCSHRCVGIAYKEVPGHEYNNANMAFCKKRTKDCLYL